MFNNNIIKYYEKTFITKYPNDVIASIYYYNSRNHGNKYIEYYTNGNKKIDGLYINIYSYETAR